MRSVVFAYHNIGYVCLEALLRQGAEVVAVITHDDDPGENIWFRSVRGLAEQHGIPVFAPDNVNTPEWVARLRAWQPDFLFSFYYRRMLSRDVLDVASRGALNLHGSLLPRYRGRCPVNWVLIHDERESGVTLHYMEEKPDRGAIVTQRRVPITDADTALSLFHKLTAAAAELMDDTYPRLRDGTADRVEQDHRQASYFGGRRPDDGRIDWNQSARQIFNLVRATTHPYPGAFATWNETRLHVWQAAERSRQGANAMPPGTVIAAAPELLVATGDGIVALTRVQAQGEQETTGTAWATAHGVREGAGFA